MQGFVTSTPLPPSFFCKPVVCRRASRTPSRCSRLRMSADKRYDIENPAYGFVMPELNAADKAYVDGAKTDKEFMQRMTQIARRIDMDRKRESERIGRQSPDDYLEGLTRADLMEEVKDPGRPKPVENRDLRDLEAEEYDREIQQRREEAQTFKMDRKELDRKVKGWEKELREMAEDGEDVSIEEDDIERKVREVQRELRAISGVSEDELEPEDEEEDVKDVKSGVEEDIEESIRVVQEELRGLVEDESKEEGEEEESLDEVDRQIDFLQRHLDKLKREEAEEARKQSHDEPEIEGLADTAGEMSAEEKMAAFAAIRRQAMQRSGEYFEDPLAKPLPNRKQEPKVQAGEEDERFDDLLELEAEVKRYLYEAKDLLRTHEENMLRIVNRLKET